VDAGIISYLVNHCCIVVMDVLAKSMYGFALLKFQLLVDKSQVTFGELKVTLAELRDERQHEKKQLRKMLKELDEEEMKRRMEDDDDDDDDAEDFSTSTKGKSKKHESREREQSPSPALSNQWPSPYMGGIPSMPMPVMAGFNVPAGTQGPAISPGMDTMQPLPSPTSGRIRKDTWRSM
jgi:L-fucose isomerase-like protein